METKNELAKPIMIEIYEINDEVIDSIRAVDKNSEGYKILASSIEKDGQLYPITVRELNADEKAAVMDSKVKYGIIDGHHRFYIAKDSGKKKILANIVSNMNSKINDMILAFKLNNTNLRMTPIQKGEVISKLMKLYEENGNKKSAGEIGEEIFGLKTAMAYRCLQAFKQTVKNNTSTSFSNKCDFNKLNSAFKKLSTNIDFEDTNQCDEQLNAIKEIESQLRFYKKFLLSQQDIKEHIQNKKSTD